MSTSPSEDVPLPPGVLRQVEILSAGAAQVLPAGGLGPRLAAAAAAGRPLRVKLGIDPSGSELTLGHAVVLRKLRQFQDLGHLAVLIIGDFTGMVGDPTGRSAVRSMLTAEQTSANAATYLEQVMRVLDPGRVEIRRNSEWLAPMTLTEVIKEASVLTVARLLERDDFAKRYAAAQPISLVEFLYPLLQGYDSVAIEADVELGGTDQTYNLLVGRDFQRAHGQEQQLVLTVPLLEGLDGVQKMSKSLGNYVSLTEPAAEQFGKLMSIPDGLVVRYAQLCTDLLPEQVADVSGWVAGGGPPANEAKRFVARSIVALYHGSEEAAAAEESFDERFRRREVPTLQVAWLDLPAEDPVHLPRLLVEALMASSTSEGRRLVDDGAVRLDGVVVPPRDYDRPHRSLEGVTLQRGKKLARRLRAAGAGEPGDKSGEQDESGR